MRAAAPRAEVHVPDAYPKWIASLGRSVDSADEEAELLGLPTPLPSSTSSEQPGDAPAASAEVNHPVAPQAPASGRLDALEQKVDAITDSFARLEAMLGRIAGGHAPPAPPEPPAAAKPEAKIASDGAQRSPESIARGEKIKAGIAARKAAAEADAAPPEVDAAPVVTDAPEAVD